MPLVGLLINAMPWVMLIHVFLLFSDQNREIEGNVRMMYYSVMTQGNSEKEIPSAPIRCRT